MTTASITDLQPGMTLGVVGYSGLKNSSGTITEEQHKALRNNLWLAQMREMADNCPITGRGIRTLKLLMRQTVLRVEPADKERPSALAAADFLEQCVQDIDHTWEDFDADVDEDLVYGFSLFWVEYKWRRGQNGETSSKFNDGRLGWAGFRVRGQETRDRWEIDQKTGKVLGMWQIAPGQPRTFLPLSQCLLFRYNARKNSPEGTPLIRNAWVDYRHRKYVQQYEGIGVEHDLGGVLDLQVPPNIANPQTTDDQTIHDSYVAMASAFKQNERAFLLRPCKTNPDGTSSGYDAGLLQSAGAKQYDTDKIIRRCDSRIAMTIGDEVALLGTEKVGSFALASSKTNMLAMAVGALLDAKIAVLNRQAVEPLMRLNGFAPEDWPHFEHGDIEKDDPQLLANAVSSLTAAGILTPDLETENRMREDLGLPLKQIDEETVPGELVPTMAGTSAQTTAQQGDAQQQTQQTENLNNLSLALQRLMGARVEARNSGDTELADKFSAKIDDILARI